MIILGLTGSIGMGKSHCTKVLRRLGIPVHDSDAAVHKLFRRGGAAVALLKQAFPHVDSLLTPKGDINRKALGAYVFGNEAALRKLESIVHPLVGKDSRAFIQKKRQQGFSIIARDVPLLLETSIWQQVDIIIVVSAPAFIQRSRVLGRSGMSEERLQAVLAQQIPDKVKRIRADAVISTGLSKAFSTRAITKIVHSVKKYGVKQPSLRKRNSAGYLPRLPRKPPFWYKGMA